MNAQRLLVSDIDGTLLQEGRPTPGLDTLKVVLEAKNGSTRLVYATGRTFASTCELIEAGTLPPADAVAALVGTEVWLPPWEQAEEAYRRSLLEGWDLEALKAVAASFDALREQPDEFQTNLKLSFYLDDEGQLEGLHHALKERGLQFRLIYSGGEFLDLIPARAGKRRAVEFLQRAWQIPRAQVLTAGDSGNDTDMLADPRYQGVAVGNAQEELQDLHARRLHLADLPHAAGVLEGAEEFDFWESGT